MTEGHINPLQWNWTRWPFDFDLGSVLNPEPLVATIKAMWFSIPSLVGADDAEGRLRHAAEAHELMAERLRKIFEVLDTRAQGQSDGYMDRIIKEWKGKAADEFRKVWGEVVKQENRQAVATSATGIAKILRAVADSSAMTRTALIELLKAAAIWAGAFMALRWLARTWGPALAAQFAVYAAYLRTTRLVGMALQVLIRFLTMLRTCALALRNLPVVGRLLLRITPGAARLRSLKAAAALTRVEVEAAKFGKYAGYAEKAGKTSFASFAKTSGWVYTGVIGSQMLSQGMQGNSIFNLDPLTFAQAARITTGATLAATFAPLSGLSTKGLASGGTAGSFTAPLTKSGQAVVESGEAFGGFVSLRNPAYEALKKRLPTIGGGRGNAHKTFYQAIPTAVFRVWRPLHTTEKPEELPQWQQPSTGEHTLQAPPRVHMTTAKVGYWPVNGTLAEISQKVYGDPGRWREIYDANKDIIGPDPQKLRAGQVLRIPLDD
ncbi:hypothetical protein GCM10010149_86320 [Nonomuraea roseoviolacea subsp. roseoviolacea]|uniref:LysM domain-containing protein n=1 Tax=Nonomuraea roseoviolacea subsp. carminata TaxID=160689 RepID=A0ABT1JW09_9ACTN|nr:hypothetical protein [Nonomuraea roseoviolacea]MCP2345943.1 hypothetical protein [Nonomuraea roseoviolacea subsp. carminata]